MSSFYCQVSASQDGNMIVWDATSMRKIYRIELRSNWVMTCAFGQCGEGRRSNFIACGGLDNVLSVYDVSKKPNDSAYGPIELNGHDGYLSCCRFIGEREMLTSSGDGHIFHWDLERKKKVAQFEGHAMDVMCVAISPTNENIFASGSVDETVKVWDRRDSSMRCTHTFQKFHTSDINAVAFFPEGWSVGTGSDDSTCRIFDIRCYGQVSKFEAEGQSNGAVTSVAFSKSGRLLFAGYESNKCCGWDVLDNSNTPSWEAGKEHNERVSCLGVSPNGHALCTGSWDTHLRIWA